MGSASLTGVICINCKTRYPAGVTDQPCPKCGSVRRTFLQATTAEIKPQGMVEWLRTDKQDRVLGYGDTGRHGAVRHGNLELDNTIALMIEGRAPRNEEDTDRDVDGRSDERIKRARRAGREEAFRDAVLAQARTRGPAVAAAHADAGD
jgi:hypothetical protein